MRWQCLNDASPTGNRSIAAHATSFRKVFAICSATAVPQLGLVPIIGSSRTETADQPFGTEQLAANPRRTAPSRRSPLSEGGAPSAHRHHATVSAVIRTKSAHAWRPAFFQRQADRADAQRSSILVIEKPSIQLQLIPPSGSRDGLNASRIHLKAGCPGRLVKHGPQSLGFYFLSSSLTPANGPFSSTQSSSADKRISPKLGS